MKANAKDKFSTSIISEKKEMISGWALKGVSNQRLYLFPINLVVDVQIVIVSLFFIPYTFL